MEKENPQQLKQFRAKVLSKTSSFFSDAKDIKLCIHESLSEYTVDRSLRGWVSGADVPDIKALRDEIAQLRAENAELRKNLEEKKRKLDAPPTSSKFDELMQTLGAIEIIVPANLAKGTESKSDLLNKMYGNKETLITGIFNSIDMSPAANFFYYNLLPKLQAHGLADNEKVPGARYRRGFLNKQGCALVAEMEKRLVKAKGPKLAAVGDGKSAPGSSAKAKKK